MTTGRVFLRSAIPRRRWPSAPKARPSGTPRAVRTSMRRAARSSSTSATAGARSPRRWPNRPVAWRTPTEARSRPSRSSATPAVAAHLPLDGARHLPGLRRVRGHRDRAQAGPGVSHRARRAGSLDRLRPMGELPRQYARRPRPVGPQAAPSAVRGLAGAVPAPLRGVSVPCRRSGGECPRDRRGTGPGARGGHRRGRPGDRRRVRRRADRRRDARRGGAARRLLAEDRRGLPRHGVLLIADEVMTGFGRTGRWFGLDHWAVRPDVLVAAKGATSGYWPFGFVAASDAVHDAVADGPGFVHGFTYSHGPVGCRGRQRGPADPRGRGPRRGQRHEGRAAPDRALERARRAPERRRDPRPWPARRARTRGGPRDAGAVSRAAPA